MVWLPTFLVCVRAEFDVQHLLLLFLLGARWHIKVTAIGNWPLAIACWPKKDMSTWPSRKTCQLESIDMAVVFLGGGGGGDIAW